ncbi:MAG: MoxR family ATPase [Armatimonadetes bacterium]|nr:MoxR family ATPase [Armatimonadota bacterium]
MKEGTEARAATAADAGRIIAAVERVIIGKPDTVRLAVVGLLCGGHVLIEDIPGVGKTMLARALARAIGGVFKRVQFTPDLLPADITGTSIYNQKTSDFEFRGGPVFANVLLADEINRATPKTQSALLECMEEHQVSRDGQTHALPHPFFVLATENVIEYQGTFPLPEAQLDRFLLRVSLGYPAHDDEVAVLRSQIRRHPIHAVEPVVTPEGVAALQEAVAGVYVHESIFDYIVRLVDGTRRHASVQLGASPRGSLGLMRGSQALAAVEGRSFAIPDDVKALAKPVLGHRIIVRPDARARGINPDQVIDEVLRAVPVPVLDDQR